MTRRRSPARRTLADFSFLILNEQKSRPFGEDCTPISRLQLVHRLTVTVNRNTLWNCRIALQSPGKGILEFAPQSQGGMIGHMARCTAPVRGHRSAAAAAECPACGGRYGRYGGYSSYPSYTPSSTSSFSPSVSSGGGWSGGGGSGRSAKPRWSPAGSSLVYTPTEVLALTPVRNSVETLAKLPELRDVFLCHAWDDRQGAAKELHDLLESRGVKVWFSEKDVGLGVPLLRAIDKGLANSRVGIVLVTPALLQRLKAEGIADKELSALLARERLVPVVHGTTYEALREVSPLLGSRSGLSTAENSMANVAAKLAELVGLLPGLAG
jgi:hypothetical protein